MKKSTNEFKIYKKNDEPEFVVITAKDVNEKNFLIYF